MCKYSPSSWKRSRSPCIPPILGTDSYVRSLSIRSNRSQQEVFKELKKLKTVIEASQHTMSDSRNSVLQSLSHQQLVHNQRELIRAAQSFYSTTSSAASTNESTGEGSQENRHRHHLNTHSAMGSVIESDFIPTLSSLRRRQIENYLVEVAPPYPETYGSIDEELTQGSDQYWSENAHVRSPLSVEDITHQHLAERGIDVTPGTNPSPGSDFDINHVLYTGLCQLAQRFIRSFEFSKAEDVLRQALRQCKNFAQGDPHQVRMRTQLVLVGFLQGKGRDMEASVLDLAKFQVGKAIASQLMYLLILAHVLEKDHGSSQRLLPELTQGAYDPETIKSPTEFEIMQLLAASYRLAGDSYQSAAIEEMFPTLKSGKALPTVLAFILGSEELLLELMGPSEDSHVQSFKKDLARAERQRLRQGTPTRIRWLRERSRFADDEISIHTHVNENNCEGASHPDPQAMSDDQIYTASTIEDDPAGPSKWWHRTRPSKSSFMGIGKIFCVFEKKPETAQRRHLLPTTHEPISSSPQLVEWPELPEMEETHRRTSSDASGRLDYTSLPTMVEAANQLHRASISDNLLTNLANEPSAACRLEHPFFMVELDGTSLPVELDATAKEAKKRADDPSQATTIPGSLRLTQKNHTRRLLTKVLYEAPIIAQTLGDYVATMKLEKALSLYSSQVQAETEIQSGLVDSGYGSVQGFKSVANKDLEKSRHVSHEGHLRALLEMKVAIPARPSTAVNMGDAVSDESTETQEASRAETALQTQEVSQVLIALESKQDEAEERRGDDPSQLDSQRKTAALNDERNVSKDQHIGEIMILSRRRTTGCATSFREFQRDGLWLPRQPRRDRPYPQTGAPPEQHPWLTQQTLIRA